MDEAGRKEGNAGERHRPQQYGVLGIAIGSHTRQVAGQQHLRTGMKRVSTSSRLQPKWYTTAQVAELLGFGLYKTKMLIASGELRSLKDGRYRRILPEWVDDYIARRVEENQQ